MSVPQLRRPTTVDEAVTLLHDAGERGRALSGGATLIAMMNAGLVDADCLVSLKDVSELSEFSRAADGQVRIGAMRRHRQTAFESDLRNAHLVVSEAAAQIANPPVRNMGTMGGSIAFADPAADYPGALVAADAQIEIAGIDGRREVAAQDFFEGWYETALNPGEIVTAVILPATSQGARSRYTKLCRVAGDFAICSIAATGVVHNPSAALADRRFSQLRLAVGGCGGGPVRVPEAEQMLIDEPVNEAALDRASACVVAALDPVDDVRASASYRLNVAPRMIRQTLQQILAFEASPS